MTEFVIGLVTEGPSDQRVLKTLIPAYIKSSYGLDQKISFKNLQPIDRTTGGGWRNVFKWCIANNHNERETLLGKNRLFDNDMDNQVCNALLIHMDSDVCEKIGDCSNVTPVPDNHSTSNERGAYIKQVIERWLWVDQTPQSDRHIIAPAVESIEAWLVAGLSDADPSPEAIPDIQRRLAELNYTVVKKAAVPKGIKTISKTEESYQKILDVVIPNFQRVFDRCPHFQSMVQEIRITMEPSL